MQQPLIVVPYVKPSIVQLNPQRRYRGAKIERGRLKVYRGGPPDVGGLPVRRRGDILRMSGHKV